LPILYEVAAGGPALEKALSELFKAADRAIADGVNILILSDRGISEDQAGIPALLAMSGLHHHLVANGTRTQVGLVLESGEPREVHHFALLTGYGAGAVNPYLVFESIEDIIRRRLGRNTLGFHASPDQEAQAAAANVLGNIQQEDLLQFGLIPEFIGRLPVISALRQLTEEELMSILTEPKNALVKQYGKQLAMHGVKLRITKDALQALAAEAVRRGTGARALRSIFESLMLDVMFEVPSRGDIESVTINRQVVLGERPPLIRRKRADQDAA
jgi:hypothetical protein